MDLQNAFINIFNRKETVKFMKNRKVVTSLAIVSITASLLGAAQPAITQADTKLKVSVTKCTLKEGDSKTLSANQKVTWKTSDKKVVVVKTTNGKKTKITAKKKGKCNITARVGKKKAIIKVTVNGKTPKPTKTPNATQTDVPATPIPTTTPDSITPTATPGAITGGSITDAPTPTGTPTTDTQIYMNETGGVSVGISDVKNTSGTITIKNTSGHDISFGLEFSIQKYENGQWNTLKANEVVIPAIAVLVHDKDVYSDTIQWKDSYGTLSEGIYRIVKTIYMGEQNKSIASAFIIE